MNEGYILSNSDEHRIKLLQDSIISFVIDIAYRHGMSVGFSFREHLNKDGRFYMSVAFPKFNRLKVRWFYCYGLVKIQIVSGDLVGFDRFLKDDNTPIDDEDMTRFIEMERHDEFEVFGRSDRQYEVYGLCASIVESTLTRLLNGIIFDNHFGLCQSGVCLNSNRYEILSNKIGDRWICDECVTRLMLQEPAPNGIDETPKEKTEREKLTPSMRFDILLRDNFTCRTCGRSALKGDDIKLHVDHIKPIFHGGKTETDNLQTLCQDCNLGKSAKWDRQLALAFNVIDS